MVHLLTTPSIVIQRPCLLSIIRENMKKLYEEASKARFMSDDQLVFSPLDGKEEEEKIGDYVIITESI